MNYNEFLQKKAIAIPCCGFSFEKSDMNSKLFEWQKDIVAWSLKKGSITMREILFRGKDIYGKWLYGDLINLTDEIKQICDHTQLEHAHSVNPDTVGQYTGLTDETGKKIFEGDIVKVYLEISYLPSRPKTIDTLGVVEFNKEKSSYYSVSTSGEEYAMCFIKDVIGNIHDNPELLEEKK